MSNVPAEPSGIEPLPGQMELPFGTPEQRAKYDLLVASLQAAVPLWILQMRHLSFDERKRRAEECSQIVAEKGDIILFRSEKRGETAKAFSALAEGIAVLAFQPGGVKVFGCHWEAEKILREVNFEVDPAASDADRTEVTEISVDDLLRGVI
jgi:hypothetical protein